jgi:predicted phosphodiesterase
VTTIAAFSDVHGNTPALVAVLDAIAKEQVDVVVNLGDIASGGVDPRGTVEVLRDRPEILHIRGNHERQLTGSVTGMSSSDQLARRTLTSADLRWLASLPSYAEPAPGVLAFHGSPSDDLCYLLETVTPAGLREATDAEVVARLAPEAQAYALYLCGHTHLQRARRLPSGALVVNPGSVGWPAFRDDVPYPHKVEAGTPHARFTLIEERVDGWTAREFAIDYDREAAVALARANERPDVVRALQTGRV